MCTVRGIEKLIPILPIIWYLWQFWTVNFDL